MWSEGCLGSFAAEAPTGAACVAVGSLKLTFAPACCLAIGEYAGNAAAGTMADDATAPVGAFFAVLANIGNSGWNGEYDM